MRAIARGRGHAAEAAEGRRLDGRERLAPYAFLSPLLAVFAAFYLWPALNTIASSLFEWGLLRPWRLTSPGEWDFVALRNYVDLFSSDRFWNAVVNTAIWLLLFPFLVVATSLLISVLIWNARAGAIVFRTTFVLPLTISLAAAGVMWSFVYNPDFGVLSAVVDALHLNFSVDWGPLQLETRDWLSDPGMLDLGVAQVRLANLSLVLAAFWAFTGFGVITFTAGLTAVSQDLVEAAIVDGARARHVVRHVLLPALRGPLIVVGVISVIFALRTFDIVWVMTRGGPATDTEVLAVLLWKQAFAFFDTPQAGEATAIAVILSAVLVIGAYPLIRGLLRGAPR